MKSIKVIPASKANVLLHEEKCSNCQKDFKGRFCPNCGQAVKNYDRPLQFLIFDFAGNIFAFDSRIWHSLINILFRPGKMEQDYLEGKRIRYMPPFRLYVFMSFLLFLLLSFATNISIKENLKASQANVLFEAEDTGNLLGDSTRMAATNSAFISGSAKKELSPDRKKIDTLLNNPEFYIDRTFKYFSWALFFLMPLYGFFLWIFFRKSRKYYLAHYLSSINQHVFSFFVLIIILAIQLLFTEKSFDFEEYLLLTIPAYSFINVWKLYKKSVLSTFFRLAAAFFLYIIVTGFTTFIVIYFSFSGLLF